VLVLVLVSVAAFLGAMVMLRDCSRRLRARLLPPLLPVVVVAAVVSPSSAPSEGTGFSYFVCMIGAMSEGGWHIFSCLGFALSKACTHYVYHTHIILCLPLQVPPLQPFACGFQRQQECAHDVGRPHHSFSLAWGL
jgi:hypothetical protein